MFWCPLRRSRTLVQITCWAAVGFASSERGMDHSSMNSAVIRVIVTIVAAVGAFGGPSSLAQDSHGPAEYVSRAHSGTQGGVRVSAAALSAEESATVYGARLADK